MAAECVFIIGCPRSGTSALSWGLAQHRELWTSAESDFLLDLFGRQRLREIYDKCYTRPDVGWLKKQEVSFSELATFLGQGVNALFRSRSKGRIWIDATPGYTLMADDLAEIFPESVFLHIVRDGRRVVSSMINSGFDMPWANDFKTACETWQIFVKRGLRFEHNYPQQALRVNHEQLVAEPEQVCQEIFAFIGVEHWPKSVDFLANRRINSSHDNVEKKDIRSVKDTGRLKSRPWLEWSNSQKAMFESVVGPLFNELGYTW